MTGLTQHSPRLLLSPGLPQKKPGHAFMASEAGFHRIPAMAFGADQVSLQASQSSETTSTTSDKGEKKAKKPWHQRLGNAIKKTWNDFVQWLKNLWDGFLRAIGARKKEKNQKLAEAPEAPDAPKSTLGEEDLRPKPQPEPPPKENEQPITTRAGCFALPDDVPAAKIVTALTSPAQAVTLSDLPARRQITTLDEMTQALTDLTQVSSFPEAIRLNRSIQGGLGTKTRVPQWIQVDQLEKKLLHQGAVQQWISNALQTQQYAMANQGGVFTSTNQTTFEQMNPKNLARVTSEILAVLLILKAIDEVSDTMGAEINAASFGNDGEKPLEDLQLPPTLGFLVHGSGRQQPNWQILSAALNSLDHGQSQELLQNLWAAASSN